MSVSAKKNPFPTGKPQREEPVQRVVLEKEADFDMETFENKVLPRVNADIIAAADEFVSGLFELLPQDVLDQSVRADNSDLEEDDELKECLAKLATREREASKGKKTKPIEVSVEKKEEVEEIKLELPPKFHLEPVPDKYQPEKIDFAQMSGDDFRKRFHEMRAYMQARRKASTAAAKQQRRQLKRQSKQDKIKHVQGNKTKAAGTDSETAKKQEAKLITTAFVSEDAKVGKSKAGRRLDPKAALLKLQQQKEGGKETSAVKTALKKAAGQKLQDDASRLKKSVKRREKQKQRSAKAWQERKDEQSHQQAERQDRRERNIQERKLSKGNKGAKKGSFGPKKSGFGSKKNNFGPKKNTFGPKKSNPGANKGKFGAKKGKTFRGK